MRAIERLTNAVDLLSTTVTAAVERLASPVPATEDQLDSLATTTEALTTRLTEALTAPPTP